MIFLRTLEGAVKCALRDLLREALTVAENFIVAIAEETGRRNDTGLGPILEP